MPSKKKEGDKFRYWTAIAWVESVNKDYIKHFEKINQKAIISPLHDKDFDDEGNPQKPHYHVVLAYDGPTTLNNVRKLCEKLNLGTYVEPVKSIQNIINYLTHNSYKGQGKHLYNANDIQFVNCELRDFVKYQYKEIVEYIVDHNITNFSILCKSLIANSEYDLLEYVSNKSYFVNTFISSLKNEIKDNVQNDIRFLYNLLDQIAYEHKVTLDEEVHKRLTDLFESYDIVVDGEEYED